MPDLRQLGSATAESSSTELFSIGPIRPIHTAVNVVGRRTRRGERGTAIIEAAITLPLFLMLIFGVMEFGLAFRTYLTTSTTTRESTRFAATLGNAADADYQIVAKVREMIGAANAGQINTISIYRATNPNTTTATGALAGCRASSIAGLCNTYSTSTITALDVNDFGCGAAAADRYWCPTTRKVRLSDPPDYLGVYISIHHDDITGIFPLNRDFVDEVVFRLEPVRL